MIKWLFDNRFISSNRTEHTTHADKKSYGKRPKYEKQDCEIYTALDDAPVVCKSFKVDELCVIFTQKMRNFNGVGNST